jgi:hypothetical protein
MGKPVEVRVLSRAVLAEQEERRAVSSNGLTYFFAAFLLAAQRAFISWESLFRPAAVIPPFFLAGVVFLPAFSFAQRALAAAASFARVAADIRRRPPRLEELAGAPLRIEDRRLSNASICRRTETASSKAATDISMNGEIAGVGCHGNQLLQQIKCPKFCGGVRVLLHSGNNQKKEERL